MTVYIIMDNNAVELFESMFANCDDAILVTEDNMELPGPRIVYVNKMFEIQTGFQSKEIVGQTPRIMQGPMTERLVLDRLKKELNEGKTFVGHTVNYTKSGEEIFLTQKIFSMKLFDQNYYVSVQKLVAPNTVCDWICMIKNLQKETMNLIDANY
jgi:PAS domain S-box-containing protein